MVGFVENRQDWCFISFNVKLGKLFNIFVYLVFRCKYVDFLFGFIVSFNSEEICFDNYVKLEEILYNFNFIVLLNEINKLFFY